MGSKSLRDIAIQLSRGKHTSAPGTELHRLEFQSQEKTLLLVGTKNVGKSSLLFRFLEKNDIPKPTLALEYIYVRKSGKTVMKDICHMWELGGGSSRLEVASLFSSFSLSASSALTLVLMLDLSRMSSVWTEAETFLVKFREIFAANESVRGKQREFEHWRTAEEHTDKDLIKPFPVPLLIIAGKYDMFENLEPNKKRIAAQCLRFLAHVNGASLLFHSSSEPTVTKRSREVLNHYAFNCSLNLGVNFDPGKPLWVPFGSDSVAAIEGTTQYVTTGSYLDKYKHMLSTHFHPEEEIVQSKSTADSTLDQNYSEPSIDSLRRQKLEALDQMRTEMEMLCKYRDRV